MNGMNGMNGIPKISIKEVAKIMGKGEQCIRIGLQRGLFPFGAAVNVTGNRFNYIIYPGKFREYIGDLAGQSQSTN
jgi:hypothetical protein